MGKYALLIGVDTYGEGLQPLSAAPKDVAALREVLLNPQIGGFDEAKPLINPTQSEMAREIELWFQDRQPEDLVLLFFSGHGVKDDRRELFFAARNTEKQRDYLIRSTATSAQFINDCISRCKAKYQVLILDSCFSGAFGELVGKDDGDIPLQEQLGAEGRVVLTSTSAVDYSFEEKGADLSIYTRYLVEGIATGAADEDSDGVITAEELHRYAGRKVQEASPAMSPKIFIPQGEGYRIKLARSPQDDPKLKYRKEAERRATVEGFTIPAKRILIALRVELGISDTEAEAIEAEVLKPHKEYQRKRREYQDTLSQCLEYESPLSPRTISDLEDLRTHLRLKSENVIAIEQTVLNGKDLEGYAADLERQQQEEKAAERRRQEEVKRRNKEEVERQHHAEAERKRQEEIERLKHKETKARQQRFQHVSISPRPAVSSSKKVSRRQFLIWSTMGSFGLAMAFSINRALRNTVLSLISVEDSESVNIYSRLEELLAAKQWKDADKETFNVMLRVDDRVEDLFDGPRIASFPCEELVKLDSLWLEASDGRFGFSIQRKIYLEECGGLLNGEYDENTVQCFENQIGWRVNGDRLLYSELTFDDTAPIGHLPGVGLGVDRYVEEFREAPAMSAFWEVGWPTSSWLFSLLTQLDRCRT